MKNTALKIYTCTQHQKAIPTPSCPNYMHEKKRNEWTILARTHAYTFYFAAFNPLKAGALTSLVNNNKWENYETFFSFIFRIFPSMEHKILFGERKWSEVAQGVNDKKEQDKWFMKFTASTLSSHTTNINSIHRGSKSRTYKSTRFMMLENWKHWKSLSHSHTHTHTLTSRVLFLSFSSLS